MVNVRALGHSCFTLSDGRSTVIFDPWLRGNPEAACQPEDLEVDAVLVSHGHYDHLGDAVTISRRLNVPVIGVFELCMYCARQGCENVAPMHIGGSHTFDFGRVKLTQALHGSAVITETAIEYTGLACGFLVTMGDVTVYFAGDTGLFGDMRLIGDTNRIDATILPIGDRFTMGPHDALLAVDMLRPTIVIPTHYSALDAVRQDADAFAASLTSVDVACRVLRPGEQTEIVPDA